jgi:hypothetical protein
LLSELDFAPTSPTPLNIDNNSAIAIIGTVDQVSNRTKHINIQYHWIREALQNQQIVTVRVDTEDNVSDIFTKLLARPRFKMLCGLLGMEFRDDSR